MIRRWAWRLVGRVLAIGADPADSPDERTQKAFFVGIIVGVLPAGVLWGAMYWALGEPVAALFPWGYTVVSIACIAIFSRTKNFAFLKTVELLLILVTPALLQVALGGIVASSGVILWSFLSPLGAAVFDRERAWKWFAAFAALIGLSIPAAQLVRPDEAEMPYAAVVAFAALNIAAVTLVAFAVVVAFARQREVAQNRVETLLLDILPEEIAQRLQFEEQTIADHFEEASVLFADVVDFTPLSTTLDAREVVGLLDRLFGSFDELVDRYEVEKIKTIGDCYMVAAGVPRYRVDHAQALARLALEMRASAAACLPDGHGHDLRLRIGISSGPVVAGVIGRRRFLYDLWGDTVNMASRMESHGVPDSIHITRSTLELLGDDFLTEARGPVDVKGKGQVETWLLLGPDESAARTA